MRTLNLMHKPAQSKKAIIGGPLARAIYGPGGLADRLRAARARNTEDQGRPAMNDDGTRTYHLVEASAESRCEFCGRWTVGADGECRFCSLSRVEMVGCGDCHCPAGSDAQTRVGDLTVTCHCGCHDGEDEVVYSGKRFVERDGELVEAWEVYRGDKPLTRMFSPHITIRWGQDEKGRFRHGSVMLAWSMCADALGVDERHPVKNIAEAFARRFVVKFPDFWSLTRSEVLALIDAIQSGEVSHG